MPIKTTFEVNEQDVGADRQLSVKINNVEEFVLDLVGPAGIDGSDGTPGAPGTSGTSGRDGYDAIISVANLVALNTLNTSILIDGVWAFVATQRAYYRLFSGTWSRTSYADSSWESQDTWYIDPVSGSDENSGADALNAIKTHAELEARTEFINNDRTIYYLNQPPASDRINIFAKIRANSEVTFMFPLVIYKGFRNTLISSTFTSVTDVNRAAATPEATLITDSTIPSFTPYVGKMIVITSGASAGAIAWIAKGISANTARITPFYDTTLLTTVALPSPGDSYQICSLLELPTVMIGIPHLAATFENCKMSQNNELGLGGAAFFGCDLNDTPIAARLTACYGCCIPVRLAAGQVAWGDIIAEASLIACEDSIQLSIISFVEYARGTILQSYNGVSVALFIGRYDPGCGTVALNDVAFFDFNIAIKGGGAASLHLNTGTYPIIGPSIWGSGITTYGIQVEGNFKINHSDTGIPSNLPNFDAPTQIHLRDINKLWTDLPFYDTTSGVSAVLYTV